MNRVPIRSPRKSAPACSELAALRHDAPASAAGFRRWRGASGRSYLVSVYPIEECPAYDAAVLIAVDSRRQGCVWIGEAGADAADALPALAGIGADEVHVHLLAGDRAARTAVIRDLDWRH